ncbi:MAG: ABC transporter permease subunit [Gemmataceae bacterium]|nr:ABC transporter permease subunit [Gemmataceae bacterium]
MTATEAEAPTPGRAWSAGPTPLGALFGLTVRQHTHGRRLVVLQVLYLLPCALAVVLRSLPTPAPPDALEFALVFTLLPHGLAPLTALLYGSGIVADEVEEQTLTYLLLRAVPKWQLYLTKLLATVCVTTGLVAVGVASLYLAIYAGTDEFGAAAGRAGRMVVIMAVAQAGYCALFGFLGLYTRRALVAGIAYIVAVEGVISTLDFAGRMVAVVYYVRTLILRWLDLPKEQLDRCVDAWGMGEVSRTGAADLSKLPTGGEAVLTVLVAAAVVSAASAWLFARTEFRVKTPGSD